MLQKLPELVPGAVDVCLDGAEGQIERGGDLFVGLVLDMPEQDASPVLRTQARDGALDLGTELARLDLLQGRLVAGGKLERGRLGEIRGRCVWGAFHAHGVEL